MKIKCLIVDDEPLAQRVLEKYIAALPSLELIAKCGNALEAASLLHERSVDLIFLDIKMPELSGLDFIRTLASPPKIILTTAYSEYALDGYELGVMDYLLKPIAFERFLKAINKVTASPQQSVDLSAMDTHSRPDFIFLREDKVDYKVKLSDIMYLEACGNYVKVFARKKMYLVNETLTAFETQLPESDFIRVHKSFIISLNKIEQIIGNMVKMGDANIPLGNYYRKQAEDTFKKFHLP